MNNQHTRLGTTTSLPSISSSTLDFRQHKKQRTTPSTTFPTTTTTTAMTIPAMAPAITKKWYLRVYMIQKLIPLKESVSSSDGAVVETEITSRIIEELSKHGFVWTYSHL